MSLSIDSRRARDLWQAVLETVCNDAVNSPLHSPEAHSGRCWIMAGQRHGWHRVCSLAGVEDSHALRARTLPVVKARYEEASAVIVARMDAHRAARSANAGTARTARQDRTMTPEMVELQQALGW